MGVLNDIAATYRGPRRVLRRLLSAGQREDRALAILMGACTLMFLSQWPPLARQAHLENTELQPMIGGALMAWLFVAPLLLYVIAALSRLVAKLFRGQGDHFGARIALFWALLATSPLALLNGLVGGYIGPGVELQLVGFVWFVCFVWFWLSGMIEAESA
ncbi:YIP1 family protein [Primorskyibacter sp. S187A]|uniref:YIP1 family protein n=1 Tax=Primorskyibacter sp. S187A TaxID=3415130 RepID=UPI003C7C9C56